MVCVVLRFSSYLSESTVLVLGRQIDKFYDIHIHALIVKIQECTNKYTIYIHIYIYKDLQLKHEDFGMF